jgi:hypothetical protein
VNPTMNPTAEPTAEPTVSPTPKPCNLTCGCMNFTEFQTVLSKHNNTSCDTTNLEKLYNNRKLGFGSCSTEYACCNLGHKVQSIGCQSCIGTTLNSDRDIEPDTGSCSGFGGSSIGNGSCLSSSETNARPACSFLDYAVGDNSCVVCFCRGNCDVPDNNCNIREDRNQCVEVFPDDFECKYEFCPSSLTLSPTAASPTLYPTQQSCVVNEQSWLRDGYCDSGNYNSEECGWDGGDCCESTCADSRYVCGTNGYNCLDPNA